MFRRRETVPFSFVAAPEAESFSSNVAPPPRERPSASQLAGRALIGLTLAAGLAGALLFGLPAMESGQTPGNTQQSEATERR
ncbi:hypothetical protein GCM10010232_10260 [Streptomyces amakusaensis]|uniref:Uncharacterized protein n=1 Tax=Streptomyces amakusaensis TaxID=67271 RepID=A0ABW0AP51_9ACTN